MTDAGDERPATKGERRRRALLDALEELLGERPLSAVGIDDIAGRAGITRSSFYFYFPTKAAAVDALIDDVRAQLLDHGRRWYAPGDLDVRAQVLAGLGDTVGFWRANARPIVAMLDAAGTDPDVGRTWEGMLRTLADQAADRIRRDAAAADALEARGVEVDGLARVLVDMVAGAMARDTRSIAGGGDGVPGVVGSISHVFHAAVYGAGAGADGA